MTNPFKGTFLSMFRPQLKSALAAKFQENPEKLKTVDMKELSKEYIGNPLISTALKTFGIEASDIEKVLTECRDELLKEANA